jgi:hypothetical protein
MEDQWMGEGKREDWGLKRPEVPNIRIVYGDSIMKPTKHCLEGGRVGK